LLLEARIRQGQVRVNVEALGKLCQGLFTLEGFQRHLGFELGLVITTGSSGHVDLLISGIKMPYVRQGIHLYRCSDFWGQL